MKTIEVFKNHEIFTLPMLQIEEETPHMLKIEE
jgi:hypothetical protein